MSRFKLLSAVVLCFLFANAAIAQSYRAFVDAVVKEETNNPYIEKYANELINGIGPRLIGTPQLQQAHDWAVAKYKSWGIDARNEKWGDYNGWERGITHVDLVSPRVKSLEALLMGRSPGLQKPVTGEVVVIPNLPDTTAMKSWLQSAKGKFVLMSPYQPTGWPDEEWAASTSKPAFDRMKRQRDSIVQEFNRRRSKINNRLLTQVGIAGLLVNNWTRALGAERIMTAQYSGIPTIDISLEDYSMLYHLAESGYKPMINVDAQSKSTGWVPAYNTIAEIKGKIPNEYVMLSAHLDSWDGGAGATDNGTGTIMMMEAMRLLKKFYPNPKRTILAGHWGAEELGSVGARAFIEDHPEIIKNTQALFNHDNGTGRIGTFSGRGYPGAEVFLKRWLVAVPDTVKDHIKILRFPGAPSDGGSSDHTSFGSVGVPAFSPVSLGWQYLTQTWHTNKDTYDKIVFDDVRNNAMFIAVMVYMACEDNERISKPETVTEPARKVPRKL